MSQRFLDGMVLCALLGLAAPAAGREPDTAGPMCQPGHWRPCPMCLPGLSLDPGRGRQVCATGTWDLVCEGAEREVVELAGADPRLSHQEGAATAAGGWRVAAQAAAGAYVQDGPRRSLPEGAYRAEFQGQAQGAALDFIVRDATTGRVLAQDLHVRAAAGFSHALTFTSPPGCHELELRVRYRGGGAVELLRTRLIPVPSPLAQGRLP